MTYYYVMIKIKYWALLAILPLFVGIIIGMSIQTTGAQLTDPRSGAQAPQQFGAATAGIVCGDRLCSESTPAAPMPPVIRIQEESMPDFMPSLGFKSLSKFAGDSSNTYAVEFTVTAAEKDLSNIKIICKSDVETIATEVSYLSALSTTTNVVRIKVMDPDSITGEIISFQIARGAPPSSPFGDRFIPEVTDEEKPKRQSFPIAEPVEPSIKARAVPEAEQPSLTLEQLELRDMSGDEPSVSIGEGVVPKDPLADAELFRVVYTIQNVGGGDVQNVAILVSSDAETVSAKLQGFLDPKHSTITVMIKAYDYESITAEIVSFES